MPARARALFGLTFLGWAFYGVRSLVTGDREFAAATGLAAALTLGVYLAQRASAGGSSRARFAASRRLGHANSAIATVSILVVCQLSGQVLSPSLAYLVCVPLSMGYLLGFRSGAVWAAICGGAALLNDVLMRVAPLRPVYAVSTNDYTLATVVLIALTIGLVAGSERVHAAHVAALRKREETISSLMEGLEKKSREAEQARDRAIAASRAKGDFVATLSHEIRTPLNGVLGMAGLLLDDEMPPQQRELVRTIRTSGDALLGLLNDLLDFSKIEAGRVDLERAPFDVRDVVEDTFDLVGVSAANKHLRLACLAPPDLPAVIGDAGRVRQILVNLVGNAVKFTDRGEVVVEIEVTPAAADSAARELHLAVRDTGIGVPSDRLATLFEPFTQADSSTTNKFGGTGLGLAICRRLAEVMGGRTWAESHPGEGSTFHVTLRLDPAPRSARAEADGAAGKRVLVASPHGPTRRMLAAQITSLGAEAVLCDSIEAALRELTAGRIDAMIAEQACAPGDLEPAGAPHEARLLWPWEVPDGAGAVLRAPVRSRELRRLLLSFFHAETTPQPTSMRIPRLDPAGVPSVLVAEDNPVNQRVVRLMLERIGCRPDVAGNGREVLDALRARPYDLVLMDVRMPEMDGITATRVLRAELPPDRQPLVVAMTANVQPEDRKACELAGMDDFIAKPLRPADLVRVVDRARRPAPERRPG